VPKVPQEIYNYNEKAKIIYIIRDPIDRLKSVWKQTLHSGHWNRQIYKEKFDIDIPKMSLNFEEAVFSYPPFLESCKYWKQIRGYRKFFPDDQIKVLLFENFVETPNDFFKEIWDFLDIKFMDVEAINRHYNQSKGKIMLNPDSNFLFLTKIIRMSYKLPLPESIKRKIKENVGKPVPTKISFSKKFEKKLINELKNDMNNILDYMKK
jgi:hypothetical protein